MVPHNRKGDCLAKVMPMLAQGLHKELPILLAVIAQQALPPQRAGEREKIGKHHRRARSLA